MVIVGEGWAGSMPIILGWQVTMLLDMVPHASWTIWLTNRVDPTIWVGACSTIGSGGVWGNWLPCRVLVISMNPGGGAHGWAMVPLGGVSTFGLEVASGSSLGVATDIGHPTPLIILNIPLIWALWVLLQLCSKGDGDSVDSFLLDGVILIQLDGASSLKTSWSVNMVRGSMASLSSWTHSASWHGSPAVGSLAFSTQYCSTLAYAKSSGADEFYNPACQSSCHWMGDRHPGWGNVGWVVEWSYFFLLVTW